MARELRVHGADEISVYFPTIGPRLPRANNISIHSECLQLFPNFPVWFLVGYPAISDDRDRKVVWAIT